MTQQKDVNAASAATDCYTDFVAYLREAGRVPDSAEADADPWVMIRCSEATKAANLIEMLEVLFNQFRLRSPHMDGSHSWTFGNGGWPWTHAKGPTIEAAIQNVIAEIERDRHSV